VESPAYAIRLYISITYSCPSAFPSYSPTTRLHWHPFSKGGDFASDDIDDPFPRFNGAMLSIAQIIKFVMASAAKSELAALFVTA
jgi:hypothetical protein